MSMFNGYSWNERRCLSLGIVDVDIQEEEILTLVWGEPETTGKTSTEPHKQAEIRCARRSDAVCEGSPRKLRRQLAYQKGRLRA